MTTSFHDTPAELIPVEEACRRLGVGRSTLYRAFNKGQVPGQLRLGNRWVIVRAAFDRLMVDGLDAEPAQPASNPFIIDITSRKVS